MGKKLKKLWKSIGPGFITGASGDDPSGIITYSVAGSRLGTAIIWTMPYILPLMIAIQKMSAKIGISSSCGLTGNIKRYYPRSLLIFISVLILFATTFNIGANVFGMASAIDLVLPGSALMWSYLIVILMIFLTIKLSYRKIVSVFKWLALALISYIVAGLMVITDWPKILREAIIPTINFSKDYLIILTAVFGTTISPYLAFWQASEEAEEKRIRDHTDNKKFVCKYTIVTKHELRRVDHDTEVGMFFSNFVGFFIIALTGTVLFGAGIHNIETVKDAAEALRPLAGQYSYLLFTFGIIGAGLLSIPILAGSAAYVLSEIFDWKASLDRPFSKAKQFYTVMIIATAIGLIIPYLGIGPVKALFWTAIIQGIIAPFLIWTIIHMANNPAIVGPNVNSKAANFLGYLTLAIMTAAPIAFLVTTFF